MISVPLLLTGEHSCSYLDGRRARSAFVHPSYPLTPSLYSRLIEQGFRRSGDEIYKPHCSQCSACLSARLEVARFRPNRSQKRCWIKNSNTQAIVKPPVFEQAHYDLYLRYQMARHGDSDMADASPDDYIGFLSSSWCNTKFVEFSINNELAGVAVVDWLDNALSAVYTFFDPKFSSHGLGVYAVLWQLEEARKQHMEFLYLGFWIKECKKMAYKNHYQPMQLLIDRQWHEAP